MHPLQTFNGVTVPPLEGKVFTIEGDAQAVRKARKIARAVGANPSPIEARNKPLYHAAGALAAGHALVVVESAIQLMMSLGMKRSEAMRAVLPMTKQVLQNYERLGMKAAWTGPLARGDYEVVAKHLAALQDYSPEYCKAYDALNRLAERILPRDGEDTEPTETAAYLTSRTTARISSSRASHSKKVVFDRGKRVNRLQIAIEHAKLPNGLDVVIAPDSTAPVVTVGVYYKIGFRLEPQGRSGFAHLFEHMMFQGSANAPKMQHIKLINSSGGIAERFDAL